MVLGTEVVVGSGRGHTGPSCHISDGQARVALFVNFFGGGVNQLLDDFGLAFGQAPSGGFEDRSVDHEEGACPGMCGVPSRMGGNSKEAAVVIRVILVMSASGSVSLSSSMISSHRQWGDRPLGTLGGR